MAAALTLSGACAGAEQERDADGRLPGGESRGDRRHGPSPALPTRVGPYPSVLRAVRYWCRTCP
eukprot:810366-Rhodomonas_salina.3